VVRPPVHTLKCDFHLAHNVGAIGKTLLSVLISHGS